MFDVHCPDHGCRVLLSHSRIVSITNQDEAVVLRWRCTCGHEGELVTGKHT